MRVERFENRAYGSGARPAEALAGKRLGGIDIRRVTAQSQSIQRSTREMNVESHRKLGVSVGFRGEGLSVEEVERAPNPTTNAPHLVRRLNLREPTKNRQR